MLFFLFFQRRLYEIFEVTWKSKIWILIFSRSVSSTYFNQVTNDKSFFFFLVVHARKSSMVLNYASSDGSLSGIFFFLRIRLNY